MANQCLETCCTINLKSLLWKTHWDHPVFPLQMEGFVPCNNYLIFHLSLLTFCAKSILQGHVLLSLRMKFYQSGNYAVKHFIRNFFICLKNKKKFSLPRRKHVYQQCLFLPPMWSSTQSVRAGHSLPTKEDGKDKGNGNQTMLLHIQSSGLFCSTRGFVSSILLLLSYIISLIKGPGVGLRTRDYFRILLSKLYPQNSCEVPNSPANIWIASPYCTCLDAGPVLPRCAPGRPAGITNGVSSHSSWDKTTPSWKCKFFFMGFRNSLAWLA